MIDVGINRVEDPSRERGYRLVGDVDFEAVRQKAGPPHPGAGRGRADDDCDAAEEHAQGRSGLKTKTTSGCIWRSGFGV